MDDVGACELGIWAEYQVDIDALRSQRFGGPVGLHAMTARNLVISGLKPEQDPHPADTVAMGAGRRSPVFVSTMPGVRVYLPRIGAPGQPVDAPVKEFERLASIDRIGAHELTADAEQADLILFTQCHMLPID